MSDLNWIYSIRLHNLPRHGEIYRVFRSELEANRFAADAINNYLRRNGFPTRCGAEDWQDLLWDLRLYLRPDIDISMEIIRAR